MANFKVVLTALVLTGAMTASAGASIALNSSRSNVARVQQPAHQGPKSGIAVSDPDCGPTSCGRAINGPKSNSSHQRTRH